MGIEYRHCMVVDDAHWRPQTNTVERVEAVLRQWALIGQDAEIVRNLCAASKKRIPPSTSPAFPGAGIAIVYPGAVGHAVEAVSGPSAYPHVTPHDRYLMRTTLLVGDDYRVQWSSESIYFELMSPPLDRGVPIVGQDEEPHDNLFSISFSSEKATAPPVVLAHVADHAKPQVGWDACLGDWRGALVLDFGKDLPSFSEKIHALPAREFVAALSDAFRGPLIDIGEFY